MSCDDQVLFILKSHPRRKTSWIVIGMAVHQDQVSRFKFSKVVVQKILMAFRIFIKWVFIELAMLVACDKSSIPHITNHEIMSRSTAATEGNCLPGCIWFIIVQWQTVTHRLPLGNCLINPIVNLPYGSGWIRAQLSAWMFNNNGLYWFWRRHKPNSEMCSYWSKSLKSELPPDFRSPPKNGAVCRENLPWLHIVDI